MLIEHVFLVSRKGTCLDNAVAENFEKTQNLMKQEIASTAELSRLF